MKFFALLALLLLIGVAIAPSINADVKEPEPSTIEVRQFENLIGLVEEIVSFFESNYETSRCECESEEPTPWPFPLICSILFILNLPTMILFFFTMGVVDIRIFIDIAEEFNCWW